MRLTDATRKLASEMRMIETGLEQLLRIGTKFNPDLEDALRECKNAIDKMEKVSYKSYHDRDLFQMDHGLGFTKEKDTT